MNKIIISGFMGSGSSAVTDLLSEYNKINARNKDFEYVLLHCPNGVFDLEDKLLIGNNMIRSDEAIRTFHKTMQELYSKKIWWFCNYKEKVSIDFMKIVDKYIDKITDFEYDGYWYEHEKITNLMSLENTAISILKKINIKLIRHRLYNNKIKISLINHKDFYKYTKDFLNDFFCLLNYENKNETLVLDQLLLPYNLYRAKNYFDHNTKIIVVHRDPRDVFILNKYVWKPKDVAVPFPEDVEEFCAYYNKIMKSIKDYSDNPNILDINFEDLIYNYDITVKKIEQFCNLDKNIARYEYFNPNISKKNTNIKLNNDISNSEKEYIKQNLEEYLYDFSGIEKHSDELILF